MDWRGAGRKLKDLNFRWMGTTDVGARLLGKAFATNALPPSLQTVELDSKLLPFNNLMNKGRGAIKKGLEEGGWLKRPGFTCHGLESD